ncbi:MAG: Cobalt-zinc-cadmium resistance protein CzcA [Fibrobacteres bacterium]|nr:Cobalt-zinc-cadmium resistance protein CzcA [Fibrobacterota bacterium]
MNEGFSPLGFLRKNAKAFLFLTFVLALAGVVQLRLMPVSLFPDITFPRITILADNGEQPVERMMVEVTKPLEEVATSLPGMREVRSITGRGSTEISLFLDWNVNVLQSLQMLQGKISDIRNVLPPNASVQAEQMTVSVFPVMGYSLASSKRSLVELRDMALYQVRPALLGVPGVAKVEVTGGKSREYLIACDPGKLQSYGITAAQVSDAISKTNQISAFGLTEDNYKIYLSLASGALLDLDAIGKATVAVKDGVPIQVATVAEVGASVKDELIRTTAQGGEAVLISLLKQPQGSTVQIGMEIQKRFSALKLPPDVKVQNFYDQGDFIRGSISSTQDSILIGMVLAMIVLFLFLKSWRVTLVVALVVPCTLAATFACLRVMGQTVNIMTLGGIAAAVGLLIDDSIVVLENIFFHLGKGDAAAGATTEGFRRAGDLSLKEMFAAIIGSTATTLVIYLPLVFLGGLTGRFFAPLAITMAIALSLSFIFSITLTPLLASRFIRKKDMDREREKEGRHAASGARYEKIIRSLLRMRLLIVPAALGIFALSFLIYRNVGSGFLPDMDEGTFILDYESPPGTSLAETGRMLAQVDRILMDIPEVESYSCRTGTQLGFFLTEPNSGDYTVKLKKTRKRGIEEVISEVRTKVEASLPALRVDFGQLMADVIGDLANNPSPIEIRIFGDDQAAIQSAALDVKARIEQVRGVVDAFEGIVISGPSFVVHIDERRAGLAGFTAGEARDQLEIAQQGRADSWVQKGEKLIPIRVRYPDAFRTDLEKVKSMVLLNSQGDPVPLNRIADFEVVPGQAELRRSGLRPTVAVTARIEGRDLGSTVAEIQGKLARELHLPPGMSLEYGGLYASQQESFRGLLWVSLAAVLLVFTVLLIEFREFAVPVSIFVINAMSLFGVVAALWITGVSFNVSSFVGLIMIIGIVAENAVFLMHYVHIYERQGMGLDDALVKAVRIRTRPILMTMLAAVSALLPLSLGLGAGAQMQQPLAIAVIGGFATSSFLLLFGLPMIYRLLRRVPAAG